MRGSLVKLFDTGGVIADAKKTSVSTLSTPSATPVVLLKLRIRPLSAMMNWVGPTVPIVSGGKALVSKSVAAVKLIPTVCGLAVVPLSELSGGGELGTAGQSEFGSEYWKSNFPLRI